VLLATGIRRSELAGIRCDPGDPARGDLDLAGREIRVRGKAGRERIVKISYQAARSVDRYLRVRAGHPLAGRPELWLGIGGRGPVTPDGIYQIVAGVGIYQQRSFHRSTGAPSRQGCAANPFGVHFARRFASSRPWPLEWPGG
jgi:site-specific recombinase XerC